MWLFYESPPSVDKASEFNDAQLDVISKIEKLFDEQLAAVNDVMACNKDITEHLKTLRTETGVKDMETGVQGITLRTGSLPQPLANSSEQHSAPEVMTSRSSTSNRQPVSERASLSGASSTGTVPKMPSVSCLKRPGTQIRHASSSQALMHRAGSMCPVGSIRSVHWEEEGDSDGGGSSTNSNPWSPLLSSNYRSESVSGFRVREFDGLNRAEVDVREVIGSSPSIEEEDGEKNEVGDNIAEGGIFAAIARHPYFEYVTSGVIACNTVWLSIDTDYNTFDILCQAPLIFQIVNNLFCTYFVFEIAVRYLAARDKYELFADWHFDFDLLLVCSMMWECWIEVALYKLFKHSAEGNMRSCMILRIFRLFRLSRLLRTSRVIHSMPELMIIVKGIVKAMRSVVSIMIALGVIIYVVGIMFVQLLNGSEVAKSRFETVPMALNFLMLQAVCGIDADVVNDLLDAGWLYYLLFLLFVLVANLTIMNMLTGAVVDVVTSVGDGEREKAKEKHIDLALDVIAEKVDWDGDGFVDRQQLEEVLQDRATLLDIKHLEIDLVAFVAFIRFVLPDQGTGQLQVSDFCQILRLFMGNKPCGVKDVVENRQFLSMEIAHLEKRLLRHLRTLEGHASCRTLNS